MIKITLDTTQTNIYRKRMYIKGQAFGYDINCGFWDLNGIIDVMAGHIETYTSNQDTNQWTSTWSFNKDTNTLIKTTNKTNRSIYYYIDDYDAFMTNVCEFYDTNKEAADAYKKTYKKGNPNPKPRIKAEKNEPNNPISEFSSKTNKCNSDQSEPVKPSEEGFNLSIDKEISRKKEIAKANDWLSRTNTHLYKENLWSWKQTYAQLSDDDWKEVFLQHSIKITESDPEGSDVA